MSKFDKDYAEQIAPEPDDTLLIAASTGGSIMKLRIQRLKSYLFTKLLELLEGTVTPIWAALATKAEAAALAAGIADAKAYTDLKFASHSSLTQTVVNSLPSTGQATVIYYVPGSTQGTYGMYVYTSSGWRQVGTTTLEIDYYDILSQVMYHDTLGDGHAHTLNIDTIPNICGSPMILYASGVPASDRVPDNWNTKEMGIWNGAPRHIGQFYINTDAGTLYFAKHTDSVSGWQLP